GRSQVRVCRDPTASAFRMAEFEQVDASIVLFVPNHSSCLTRTILLCDLEAFCVFTCPVFVRVVCLHLFEDFVCRRVDLLLNRLTHVLGVLPDSGNNCVSQLVDADVSHS